MMNTVMLGIATLLAIAFFAYYMYRQFFWRTQKFELQCPVDGVEAFELMIHHDDVKKFLIFFKDKDSGELKIGEITMQEQSSGKES